MSDKKKRWWLVAILVVLLIVVAVVLFQFHPGLQVTVRKTGSTPIRLVVLHVTDSDGKVQRLDAGGYCESGYRGTISVSVKDGAIEKNEQDIKLW